MTDAPGNKANDMWQRMKNVRPTGPASRDEGGAKGEVDMATGLETNPCFMCKSWEKDTPRLVRHFTAHGLTIDPDGSVQTPIAKNIPGRKSMKLKIQQMGWCKMGAMPTDDMASCPNFRQVRTREDMRARLSLVGERTR
jgi:hypothetical protein